MLIMSTKNIGALGFVVADDNGLCKLFRILNWLTNYLIPQNKKILHYGKFAEFNSVYQ